jgi:DNA-binding HxlR family transcriptional regulator
MRSYRESCGIAHALDVIGERWAGLVVRELLLGPKRFADLAADLPGASASVLTDRLRELQDRGVVNRRLAGPPARVQLYELTPWGARLGPVLTALGDWALDSPTLDPELPMSDDAAALSLSTYFVSGDPGWNAECELRIGRGTFDARVSRGRLTLERGAARHPEAILTTGARSFTRMLGPHPEEPFTPAHATGDLDQLRKLLAAVRIGASA